MHRFLFILFLVFSCTQPEKATNNNIINREQFTKLIVDIHLIEAKFETIKFKNELNAKAILQNDYDSIFSLYGIAFENFEKSLKYYSLKDDNLELIYTNALEEIKKKKSQLK
tara:strand:- start:1546 stop:1881 length:336 start_codon:yes stop_codon:yes gene_type:complete